MSLEQYQGDKDCKIFKCRSNPEQIANSFTRLFHHARTDRWAKLMPRVHSHDKRNIRIEPVQADLVKVIEQCTEDGRRCEPRRPSGFCRRWMTSTRKTTPRRPMFRTRALSSRLNRRRERTCYRTRASGKPARTGHPGGGVPVGVWTCPETWRDARTKMHLHWRPPVRPRRTRGSHA